MHETPCKLADVLGLGVGCTVHVEPSQDSAKVPPSVPLVCPTAWHALAEVHDTPHRRRAVGAGVGTTVQLVPSQRSVSAALVVWPLLEVAMIVPTATQAVVVVQDTPSSSGSRPSTIGVGVGSIVHWVPSQDSARVPLPSRPLSLPTAVHAVADVQDTASRTLAVAFGGVGVGWTVQDEPFQRSANGSGTFVLVL